MRSLDVGVIPVVDDGTLVGLVTDRDLVLRVLAERRSGDEVRLGDIVTRAPVTVTPDMKLSEARGLMTEHRVRRLPVMKGDELVGILSLGDLAMQDSSERAIGETLEAISESESTASTNPGPDVGTPEVEGTGTDGN
jgi:signal-transduction protein with cAMP-binding, CBS, and nucleotidyltransferase domain